MMHRAIYLIIVFITNIQFGHLYTVHVDEEQPVNTEVVDIRKITNLNVKLDKSSTFRLIGSNNEFFVDVNTGVIYTKQVFDRESLNERKRVKGFQFVIIVDKKSSISITVLIADVNDHVPHFLNSIYNIQIREDVKVNQTLILESAVDEDIGENAVTVYTIASGDLFHNFRIDAASAFGRNEPYLTVISPLDLEGQTDHIVLNISACDNSSKLCSYNKANITISDVNDHKPLFPQNIYLTSVYENATIGQTVIRIQATDADRGSNAEVTYKVIANDKFSIHPRTGAVIVHSKLDAETRNSYRILVLGTDGGNPPLQSLTHIQIGVLDVNDNKPVIAKTFSVTGPYNVLEGDKIGTKVVSVTVSDNDVDSENNKVFLRLEQNNGYFKLQHENGNVYGIYLMKNIDREVTPQFTLKLHAIDNGVPALQSDDAFHLNVGDINDNPPIFLQKSYHSVVNESRATGYIVLKVLATDADLGVNRKITYSIISDTSNGCFQINQQSGQIYLIKPIDRETITTVNLNISASDGGLSRLSDYASVIIIVQDANDNDPYFNQKNVVFNLTENNKKDCVVGKVTAYDRDIIGSKSITYHMSNRYFQINYLTGVITAKKSFDREENNFYDLMVSAVDGGSRKGNVRVMIHILDVNDVAPKFDREFYNLSIHENFPVGQIAVYVTAVDYDEGDNARLVYSAIFQEDMFQINQSTGGIILEKDLKLRLKDTFTFQVNATDFGGLKGQNSAHVKLQVLAANGKPPLFQQKQYHFVIKENNRINELVGNVVAKRPSSGSTTFMEYHVIRGDNRNMFHINQFGEVLAQKVLDHEQENRYTLQVQVIDTLDRRLDANTSVFINILDENDNKPTFTTLNRPITVKEGVPIGFVFHRCVAVDDDSGTNAIVSYTMLNITGPFSIKNHSGEVFTTGSLDFETIKSFEIYLQASDGGRPKLSSQVKLNINVLDINDNPPIFTNSSYSVHVVENFKVGFAITNITATDADAGSNALFFFTLVPSTDAKSFLINHEGELSLKEALDRETKDTYNIQIVVHDKGSPSQKSESWIRIIVDDANDEKPQFDQSSYFFELREELPVGTIIGEVIAYDLDIGTNGEFTYSLQNHDSLFKITKKYVSFKKRSICVITSAKSFDSENDRETYSMTIIATDHGTPANTNRVVVQVRIKNINDHPPKFSQNLPYFACVTEDTVKGTSILKIDAMDEDIIPAPLEYSFVTLTSADQWSLNIFGINRTTGHVFSKRKISSLLRTVHEMTIEVKETGTEFAMVNYQKLIIFIVPFKNKIIFQDICVQVAVKESKKPGGGSIAPNFAYDNSYIIQNYKFEKQDPNTVLPFRILSNTGLIQLTNILHHKTKPYYRLNVTVEGSRNGKMFNDYIMFHVYVIPTNHDTPSYPNNPQGYTIKESWPPYKEFATLQVTSDRDEGMEGICMYTIVETSPVDAPIYISPISREIMFSQPIDREVIEQYVLKVRITDLALDELSRLSQTFTVYLSVQDVNDNKPKFVSSNQSFIMEDAAIGTIVSTVKAEDPDKGSTNTAIVYHLISGDINDTFSLDYFNGQLASKKHLNIYERQQYTLIVLASELRDPSDSKNIPSFNSTMAINVHVTDINNNIPKFTQKIYKAHVKENLVIGSYVLQVNSTDDDINPLYKEVSYDLLDGIEFFSIDEKSGVISTKTVHDRERDDFFQIIVSVKNVRYNGGENTCSVVITIDDVNDFPPLFPDGNSLKLHILENSNPAVLHKFIVTDEDVGSNAEVEYFISNFPGIKRFHLNKQTGELSTVSKLDREKRDRYIFTVTAENTSPPHQKAIQNVTIIVDDENDEKPVFEHKVYFKSVNEDKNINGTVLEVKAIDKDIGINAIVTYSLLNQNNSNPFTIDPTSGKILLTMRLDYEKVTSYILKVKAIGTGVNFNDETQVEIQVIDQNDNFPIFMKPVYSITVKVIQTTHPILTVNATDADEGGKQRVIYSFDSPVTDFSINRHGEIKITNSKLTLGHYRLHVKAKDKPTPFKDYPYPSKESFVTVLITIGNPNASSLRFMNKSVVFTIAENTLHNSNLGFVKAISMHNKQVYYSIADGSNPEYAFGIRNTGEIFVNNSAAVDYENYQSFFLGVLATTQTSTSSAMSIFLSILINLIDINDNTPVILPNNQTFPYAETNEKDFTPTLLHYFHISDADKIDQGKLRLQIISGNDHNIFAINHWKHLILIDNIDFEQQRKYHLVVRVTDGGNPVRHSDSHIYIDVEDQNDNPPVLQNLQPVSISEAAVTGTIVTTVTATDVDITTSILKYGLQPHASNSSVVDIDENLGVITLVKQLDYEMRKSYILNISVFDGIHTSFGSLNIYVTDANDNIPQFSHSVYTVNVSTTLKNNKHITKVFATDRDSYLYGRVQYKIDPPQDAFTIEQDTGNIFTNKDYRFPTDTISFHLGVVAFDNYGRSGSRSSNAIVKMLISGKRSPNPVFSKSIYHISAKELASPGAQIYEVMATFPSGLHKKLTYRIAKGNTNDAFTIDSYSGVISVNNKLDREAIDRYSLELVADVHNSGQSATCVAIITIIDVNDNSPIFQQNSYNVSVMEGVKIGTELIYLVATDADDPATDYAKIKYKIHSGQDKHNWLSINEDTGLVTTNDVLDREKTSRIQLTIQARDNNGIGGRQSIVSLNVTVLDINDNAPKFSFLFPLQPITVKENKPVDTMVLKVKAVDIDEGSNGRVSYRIINGTNMFYMKDEHTGWVYTKEVFDYEKTDSYILIVLAYDHGKPPKRASFEYPIAVEDENEYKPVFKKDNYDFNIPSTVEKGEKIVKVEATDKDGGAAGKIRYTLLAAHDGFSIGKKNGWIKVTKDLRRHQHRTKRDVEDMPLLFVVRADNGPNTSYTSIEISGTINFTCAGCESITTVKPTTTDSMTGSTLVIVLASVAVFVSILFLLFTVVYCRRKRTCFHKTPISPPKFCPAKKEELGPSSSVERELLHSNASSFDRLQTHFYSDFTTKPRLSSDTGLIQDSGGTVRSVSATDKASTYSFGIYHEQVVPESEMAPFSHTLSNMSLKDLEHDSVFAYSPSKNKKPTRSCLSRSTQESSLYSLNSNQPNATFVHKTSVTMSSRNGSHESLNDFQEEGGGEAAGGIDVGNLLYAKLTEVDEEEHDAVMDGVRPFQDEGVLSQGGSLSTIVGSDEDIATDYKCNYLNNWRPQFKPVNSVFSEIGRSNKHSSDQPPSSAGRNAKPEQKLSNDIPLQVLNSGRTSMLSSVPSLPRTPQEIPSTYTSGALSPNFTPALTPLVFRSPSVSSVGTQENYPAHSPGATVNTFQIGLNNVLIRSDSMNSQLSRITLSDINVSDEEDQV